MFSECTELAIFLYVFFAIFWYLRKKQSDLEKKNKHYDENYGIIMSFYFEAFSVSYPQCAGGGPGQSGDRTRLVLKIPRQLSVKGMSVQADGNSWKGRPKHISSLLYSTKHVRSPDWPGNHRLHTADKKREMPRNKMTL